ncbi:hypothetical protein [Mesobacillus subterraneus]|uniref:hypothetical protein n=1 Tax=Mesobacillus subterraneus TaxID=285983 RepID=UPI001CFD0A72|nr:hypothetical protein [Mesobacillus subterraneus]
MQSAIKFKPEYITILLIAVVSVVLVLTFFTGQTSLKEVLTYFLIIVLLSFITKDLKRKPSSVNGAYKYFVLIFLFAYLSLF